MKSKKYLQYSAAALLAIAMTGCKAPTNVTYFQDMDATAIIPTADLQQITVKPGDKLAIVVKTQDPAVSELFNMPVYSSRIGTFVNDNGTGASVRNYTNGGTDGIASYNVSKDGDIDFPLLGTLHVAGMSRQELAGYIKGEIMGRELAKDPTVSVEFLNTGINIIGEVNKPGRYDMNRDKMTVLNALALAGDLRITGVREKVHVIRQEGDELRNYTLDLTNASEVAKSPAYYLQQDDVVYVEPNDMRKRQTTVNGNNALSVSFWISVASLITTAVTTVGVFVK